VHRNIEIILGRLLTDDEFHARSSAIRGRRSIARAYAGSRSRPAKSARSWRPIGRCGNARPTNWIRG
jgi:hypothetical protein